MNILQYTLQLNDKMSSVLNKIGGGLDNASGKGRKLKKDIEDINNVNLSGFYSKITKVASVLGIGAILGKTVSDGMEQGMKNVSFEVLFGGVDQAKKMIDDINNYAAKAYGKTAVSNGVQMMAGFDIGKDEIMQNVRAIGDIAMGDVNKFNSLTLAFSQMSSTGKLMGQDLLQMINAGFNPLVQMSKTTGKSVAQLKDDMSKGIITAQMVKQAFYDASGAGGQFNGMIERMSNETGGLWKGALSKIELWMNRFYNWIEPVLKPALQQFNKFLDDPIGTIGRLTDKFTTDFPIISGLVIGVTAALAAYKVVTGVITIATGVWTAAQWLLNAALTANPIGLIVAGVVALIALIAFLIIKIDGWGETWDNVVKFCTLSFERFKTALTFAWLTIQDTFMSGLELIERGWYKLQSLWNEDAANEGLAKLDAQQNERAKEIAKTKGKIAELTKQINDIDVIQFKVNDTSFSDVANSIKNKIGISTPGIPGTDMTPGGTTGGTGGFTGGAGGNAGKDTANSIATGGSKTTHVYVTVGEMGNNMKIYVNDVKEGAENICDIVLDQLTRALSMAQGQI